MEVSYNRVQKTFGKFLTLHEGGPYHIETSPLICSAYQQTGFYMIKAPVMKKLKEQSLGGQRQLTQLGLPPLISTNKSFHSLHILPHPEAYLRLSNNYDGAFL